MKLTLIAFSLAMCSLSAVAAVQVPAQRRDYPTTLTSTVAQENDTHFYRYNYTLTNPSSNPAGAELLQITIPVGVDIVTEIVSPPGWRAFYSEDLGKITWSAVATDASGTVPDDNSNVAESPADVRPGRVLSGFSFKSFSPPGPGTATAQTYAPLPEADTEEELQSIADGPYGSTLPEDNGYRQSVTAPIPDVDWSGNRRPTVDGFLVFANLQDKQSFQGSALIVFRLGTTGAVVDPTSLRVVLNGIPVTTMFTYNATFKGYAARLTAGSPGLLSGKNVLITSVSGTIPGVIDKPTTDTDRVTFTFTP